jgi:hypothetical protein
MAFERHSSSFIHTFIDRPYSAGLQSFSDNMSASDPLALHHLFSLTVFAVLFSRLHLI